MGASSGPSNTSSTQRIEPPSYQLPYLQQGLGYAQGLLNQGAPQQYQGATVTPFSQQTQRAMQGIESRAMSGSPVTRAAQGYATGVLSGPNPYGNVNNPYLDQMFQQAAQQTRGQLTSEYARAGRNIQATQAPRADQLNNLATQIYGGAYDAERNRGLQYENNRLGVLGQSGALANQDYVDMGQMMGVGRQVEDLASRYQQDAQQRFDYEQQAPQMLLDQYLGRVRGTDYGSTAMGTQTGPGGGSKVGGALGTAAAAGGLAKLLGASNPWVAGAAAAGGLLGLI